MSRWKQLPTSLDPRVRQLVVHLRRAKDHSGLGLRALASRTGYSRSSWDRYLNGRALPPQRAVEAFARACDIDPARLLALHEVAVEASDGGGAVPAAAGTERTAGRDEGAARPGDRRRPVLVLAVVAAVTAVVALTALLVAEVWDDGGGARDERSVSAAEGPTAGPGDEEGSDRGPFVFQVGKDYPCEVDRDRNGLLRAGYSRTRTALLGVGSTQWSVVEAQCLLRHHGFPPGIADGAYGSRTERAVKRLQDKADIVVDGVIGEDTWEVLRG
ncbi:helix-turn-helix domain-containing protein [Streptomyces poonensis]|uniref:HTH cro/C1-type domain-containing protein n=1 Tax=Streptomyces poonensis TaxID=68255 RepID=A0A918PQ48_9ACTN|nr:helix-turn-helix domain-containing protein [Streptomyces poonensis]GGZ17522.1 hypothetical protein GCM10010365_41690 [Streptomyces poonensis]GLJ90951.1 hypothetical protein GCM10017589_35570 [Streptomyces poonensis]